MVRLPGGFLSLTLEDFQEFICLCDDCGWSRLSEVHAIELEDSFGLNQVEEIVVESGEAPSEESSNFVLVDSPPYSPTTPSFFPTNPHYTRPTSPQYTRPTSLEYFPSSPAYSPISLSDLLAELFEIVDPVEGVEVVAPPIDIVEVPIEPVEVVVQPRRCCTRRRRLRYPQHWPVRVPYRRELSVAQQT